ncbi:hypothetical protein HHK36_030278 [Tetracentron sinense]|uniref:Dihydrolipoamide acetyltransferase component of pyruvate dehydrogenase complex n=1 Tax=Tetracentron sinense TaxID=13715 RepID=A0A834Y956_TETSI|nr:hypothetical protein HHK36_030278 [Tetracentron sinense]
MPALSSTMTEGKIVSWVKSEGDKLSKGESVVVVESDKADMDVETFNDGYLAAIMVDKGAVAAVGSAIAFLVETQEIYEARFKANSSSPSSSKMVVSEPPLEKPLETVAPILTPLSPVAVSASSVHPTSEGGIQIVASPFAKKLSKDLKVELASVVGSGPMGRIVGKDVEAAAAVLSNGVPQNPKPVAQSATTKVSGTPGIELGSVVPFTTIQGAVSRNMVESLTVPTFRVGYTISTDALDHLYKKLRSNHDYILAKATTLALFKHLVVNSSCRDGKSFTYNSSINIAVAVAIDGGLITPVLQDADKVDIYTLSRKWKELVDKARAKQLQPHEYSTGKLDKGWSLSTEAMGYFLPISQAASDPPKHPPLLHEFPSLHPASIKTPQSSVAPIPELWSRALICIFSNVIEDWSLRTKQVHGILSSDDKASLIPFAPIQGLILVKKVTTYSRLISSDPWPLPMGGSLHFNSWRPQCNMPTSSIISAKSSIGIEGLSFHLWTLTRFKFIRESCGRFLETDPLSVALADLREARIRIQEINLDAIP